MNRTTCGSCGHDELRSFLDLGTSPIADAYTSEPDEPSKRYPLELAVCMRCRLVQLLEVVDHDVLFGTGYSFYSSASPPLSAYHERYATSVLSGHWTQAERLTVEVGCNDGDLLRHFYAAGCAALGVDPATGPVAMARDRGLAVIEAPFGRKIAEEIRDEYGQAGVIIANHVLAHVESVADVLDGIQHLLARDGVAYIEVQYLPDLIVNNAFDLVYHEHRNFFSFSSLEHAVRQWGLGVLNAELTDRQGGSLRVTLARRDVSSPGVASIRESESWLAGMSAYEGFQGRVDRMRDRLLEMLAGETSVLGYGAPAKATTLLNFCGLDSTTISCVVDTTAAKQGRFIPGTGIPIVALNEAHLRDASTALLLAWNYAPQIIRKHLDYMGRGGKWIVPIPSPVLL